MSTYIFDVDGTLIDSMPLWERLGIDFLHLHGREPHEDFQRRILNMSMMECAEFLRSEYGFTEAPQDLVDAMNSMADSFYMEKAPAKPGVLEAVKSIHDAGIRCVVATACERYLAKAALRRTGLLPFFSRMYTCGEIGLSKSRAEFFKVILETEKLNPSDAVLVDDALYAIDAAKANGIGILAIYDESSRESWPVIQRRADHAIASWSDFHLPASKTAGL